MEPSEIITQIENAVRENNVATLQALLENNEIEAPTIEQLMERAACWGHTSIVKLLISASHGVISPSNRALVEAATFGHIDIVQLLLEHGANIECEDFFKLTPLCKATQNNHTAIVQLLLQHHANTEHNGSRDKTPLSMAIEKGHAEIVSLLLEHGAKIEVKHRYNEPLLIQAIKKQDIDIVRLLLKHGANTEVKTKVYKATALFAALEIGSTPIFELLLQHGANPNVKDCFDLPLLMMVVEKGDTEKVRLLLEHKADLELNNGTSTTTLITAIEKNDIDMVTMLLEAGANVNVEDKCGMLPLLEAIINDNVEMVRLLLNHNANIHCENTIGKKPLLLAADIGNIEMTRLLLDSGADINTQDKDGYSVLMAAIDNQHTDIIRLLLERGAPVSANYASPDILQILLELGTTVNAFNETALSLAAENGNTDIVQILLERMADIPPQNALDAIKKAVEHGHAEIVRLLLARHTALDVTSILNETTLISAIHKKHIDIVRLLLERHVSTEVRTVRGETALIVAIICSSTPIIRLLLAQGADITAQDNFQNTALMYAAFMGRALSIRALLENQTPAQRQILFNQTDQLGQNAITMAFENGQHAAVAVLQEFGAQLPAHFNQAVHGLNAGQSTHEVSVHETVSSSTLALASQYLPELSAEEKTQLKTWFTSDFKDKNRKQYQQEAIQCIEGLLKHEVTEDYIAERMSSLLHFAQELKDTDCEFSEHNTLKVSAAKTAIERMISNEGYFNFKDSRSHMPLGVALALVWDGVWDESNPGLMIPDNTGKMQPLPRKDRIEILVHAFYEMQRGYNLNDDGEETHPNQADRPICVPGHFNKLISALAGGRHPMVNIIIVTKQTAMLRLQALIGEHYSKLVPMEQQRTHFKAIQETRMIPKMLWDNYLKEPLSHLLKEDYEGFVEANMISAQTLEKAITKGAGFMLPGIIVKKMLKPFKIGKEKSDIDPKEVEALLKFYDLVGAVTEEYDRLSTVQAIANRYETDLSNGFSLADRNGFLNRTGNMGKKLLAVASRKLDEKIERKRKREEEKTATVHADAPPLFQTQEAIYNTLRQAHPELSEQVLRERAALRFEKQDVEDSEMNDATMDEPPNKRARFG